MPSSCGVSLPFWTVPHPPLSRWCSHRAPKRNRSVTPKPVRTALHPPETPQVPRPNSEAESSWWPMAMAEDGGWGAAGGSGGRGLPTRLCPQTGSPHQVPEPRSPRAGTQTHPGTSLASLRPSQQRVVLLSPPSRPVWRPPAPPVECASSELACSVMENTPDWAKVAQNKNAEYLTHHFYIDGRRRGPIWAPLS